MCSVRLAVAVLAALAAVTSANVFEQLASGSKYAGDATYYGEYMARHTFNLTVELALSGRVRWLVCLQQEPSLIMSPGVPSCLQATAPVALVIAHSIFMASETQRAMRALHWQSMHPNTQARASAACV